jgi:hypothetical protein
MRFMSSVDALAATPKRIANRLLDDDDDDDDDVDLMVNAGNGGGRAFGGTSFSAVKRRLIPDGDADHDGTKLGTSAKSRRRTDEPSLSSEEEGGRSILETQHKSVISAPSIDGSSPLAKFTLVLLPSSLSRAQSATTFEDLPWQSESGQGDNSMLPPPQKEDVSPIRSHTPSMTAAPPSSEKFLKDEFAAATALNAIGGHIDETWRRQPTVVES